jgi:hypothetical protein
MRNIVVLTSEHELSCGCVVLVVANNRKVVHYFAQVWIEILTRKRKSALLPFVERLEPRR